MKYLVCKNYISSPMDCYSSFSYSNNEVIDKIIDYRLNCESPNTHIINKYLKNMDLLKDTHIVLYIVLNINYKSFEKMEPLEQKYTKILMG